LPSSPAIEFTRMNTTEVAAAVFVGAQRMTIISGVRKIPPPVPVRPESSPRMPPTIVETPRDGAITAVASLGS
jgi:hypothetical protein